ncbi:MAG: RsmB/NOP family class I SAM-dependent RNA methyltransferase [Sphaerochaetaceae bacterium]
MSGHEAFEQYYQQLFPLRWEALKRAFSLERTPVEYKGNLTSPYYMDEASIIAAQMLDVQKDDEVLDMCAAPGGKTMVLASILQGTGSLVSNDRSSQRRSRLIATIREHIPQQWQNTIKVTSFDSTKWGLYQQQAYDRILLDAPCSSERHVFVDDTALEQWSPARPKHLAIQQFAMLAAALEAVRIGGHILYSTCAITPVEDEQVIAKLYEKREGRFELIALSPPFAEQREYGSIILPDTAQGRGPLYFCLIRRIS